MVGLDATKIENYKKRQEQTRFAWAYRLVGVQDPFMAEVVSLANVDEVRDHIHRAVQFLSHGRVIGLPSEMGYVWACLAHSEAGIRRLVEMDSECRLQLVARSFDDAIDFLPQLDSIGWKFLRRCDAGRIVLDVPLEFSHSGLFASLAVEIQQSIGFSNRDSECSDSSQVRLRVQVSGQEIVNQLARYLPAPLIMAVPPTYVSTTLDLIQNSVNDDLVFDKGPVTSIGPTVIQLDGKNGWQVELEGVVTEENLERLANEVIVFVCTGNTCRSPMAEALFRDMLVKKLGCEANELSDRGFFVTSAGLAAAFGAPASLESVDLMDHQGIDLTSHESQPLTERLLEHADFVYTMTRGHRDAILSSRPDLADRVQVLARDSSDVPDPIGGGIEEYVRCQEAIESHLQDILSKMTF
jgi:protein-tyrosine phosphatase